MSNEFKAWENLQDIKYVDQIKTIESIKEQDLYLNGKWYTRVGHCDNICIGDIINTIVKNEIISIKDVNKYNRKDAYFDYIIEMEKGDIIKLYAIKLNNK